jgi:spore maturation protein CgeB
VSPAAPFAGRTVVLLGRFDEPYGAHSPLKRRALERLGCAVAVVEHAPKGFLGAIRKGDLAERLGRALKDHRPDLVLALGPDLPGSGIIAEARKIHSCPWTLWWPSDSGVAPTWVDVQAVDHTWVTSADLVGKVKGVRYLPHACDPSVHRPLRAGEEFRANVAFVGDATPRREALLSEVLEFGVAVWGPGWRKTRLKDYCRGDSTTVENYVRAYGGATVALNLYREGPTGEARSSSGCNARTFELAAMGLAQVMDARADLPSLFAEGEEVLAFEDPATLKAIVKDLVMEHERAAEIGKAARRRALNEHTYIHRLTTLLEEVFE